MSNFEIRKTKAEDLNRVMDIYAHARKFMAEHNNPNQWKNIKPTKEQIEDDIRKGISYVCVADNKIHGVFCFFIDEDPTYRIIYDGKWQSSEKYGVVHRIASSGEVKGCGSHMMQWAFAAHPNVRIDTHEDNYVMQNMLKKLGYVYCGIIHLENGDPRMAFQKTI